MMLSLASVVRKDRISVVGSVLSIEGVVLVRNLTVCRCDHMQTQAGRRSPVVRFNLCFVI